MKYKHILLIVFIFVVVLIGVFVYRQYGKVGQNDGTVACTKDALQCPDGSYVGRKGELCVFAPCGGTSYIGTLVQNSTGFVLHVDAPKSGTNEVVYVLPITIKISNVLGQLVGKRVQVFGSFSVGNTFVADRLEEIKEAPHTGQVGVGESQLINGVRITLNAVVQDSRCPIDVQCIEAGAINANVTLQSNTDKETRNMPSDEVPVSFDSYKISIIDIQPPRVSTSEIRGTDYKITFKVEANK